MNHCFAVVVLCCLSCCCQGFRWPVSWTGSRSYGLGFGHELPTSKSFAIKKAVDVVTQLIPELGESSQFGRMPITAVNSPAGSGKTSLLKLVCEDLVKEKQHLPIYVTFSGMDGFVRHKDENPLSAAVRVIGAKLFDIAPGKETQEYKITVDILNDILNNMSKNFTIVLVVDQLDGLGVPVDPDLANWLKSQFLNHEGRYLLFSTESEISLDSGFFTRPINVISVPTGVPFSVINSTYSKEDLRGRILHPLEVMSLAGSPAMVETFWFRRANIDKFVHSRLWTFRWGSDDEYKNHVKCFVDSVLEGRRLFAPREFVETIERFMIHVNDREARYNVKWPLAFVFRILEWMMNSSPIRKSSLHPLLYGIKKFGERIQNIIAEDQTSGVVTGKGFENVIHTVVALRIMKMSLESLGLMSIVDKDFCILPSQSIQVDHTNFEYIEESITFEETGEYFRDRMGTMPNNSLCLFVPYNRSSYGVADGFIVYKSGFTLHSPSNPKTLCDKTVVVGYKVGEGNNNKKQADKDDAERVSQCDWLDKMYWLQGGLVTGGSDNTQMAAANIEWVSEEKIKKLMGFSFEQLAAEYWRM